MTDPLTQLYKTLSRAVRTSPHALLCLFRSTSMDPVRRRAGPQLPKSNAHQKTASALHQLRLV